MIIFHTISRSVLYTSSNQNVKMSRYLLLTLIIPIVSTLNPDKNKSDVIKLTQNNLDKVLASNELVLIHFHFPKKNYLYPRLPLIIEEIAYTLKQQYPQSGRIAIGQVVIDKEPDQDVDSIVAKFNVEFYPTLKLVKNGQIPAPDSKFRKDFTYENILYFLREALLDPIKKVRKFDNSTSVPRNTIIGFFNKTQPEYDTLRRVAMNLKEKCDFYTISRSNLSSEPLVLFRPQSEWSDGEDVKYSGNATDFNELLAWASEKCSSLVIEITGHSEDLINSEHLPYLILYHDPSDKESVRKFREIVKEELSSERDNITFVTATQEKKIYHPLELDIIRKSLPLVVIDCLKHMYVFPDDNMFASGKLKQFVNDLYSGKLHREYHYGPDSERELKIVNNNNNNNSTPAEQRRALQLTRYILKKILASNEVVLITFYTTWCHFSKELLPIYDEFANKVFQEFPKAGKVAITKIDCNEERLIAASFGIKSYPRIKLVINGKMVKGEYNGERSLEALMDFVKRIIKDLPTVPTSLKNWKK